MKNKSFRSLAFILLIFLILPSCIKDLPISIVEEIKKDDQTICSCDSSEIYIEGDLVEIIVLPPIGND